MSIPHHQGRHKERPIPAVNIRRRVVIAHEKLRITLPTNMAEAQKDRVASGAYASESEVLRGGLRAHPSRAISSAGMRAHLAELHAARVAERHS